MSIALIFPGQGSQKLGMLSEIYAAFPSFAKTFEEAKGALGFDLWDLIQMDEVKLNQTEYTQPALLACSVALWRLLPEKLISKVSHLAGHSLGEYSALACAEGISFSDALQLVFKRGQLMQAAVKPGKGAMAAFLGLSDALAIQACEQAAQGQIVSAVNFNCEGQVVIAGEIDAVNRACEIGKTFGAKRAQLLPVSVPSHCALMTSAAQELSKALKEVKFHPPKIPIIHNVDAKEHSDPEAIRKALCAQLDHPVQWVRTIERCALAGVDEFIECGPGRVLAGLNKRIVDFPVTSLGSLESLQDLMA